MKPLLLTLLVAVFSTACTKSIDLVPGEPVKTDGFVTYTLKKGAHYADRNSYQPLDIEELTFVVKFDSSAIYQTVEAANQYDINKLYGFSDNNAGHHEFSARFGWRWSDGALRLFAYVYNAGIVTSQELTTLSIGAEAVCSIKVSGSNYLFTVAGETHSLPRASTTPRGAGYQLYPYFGGDEAAPHDVRIYIRRL